MDIRTDGVSDRPNQRDAYASKKNIASKKFSEEARVFKIV